MQFLKRACCSMNGIHLREYDGKRISVYVDGQLWAETFYESTIKQCATDFGIGRRLIDQPFYFNGEIDEIAVSKMIRYE